MITTHVLGYPRMGADRALKFALEAYWRGETDTLALGRAGAAVRARQRGVQRDAGLSYVCAGDFSYYDHVLDTAALLGCLPRRFGYAARSLRLDEYFALARGTAAQPAMEMTKWFDTNYHHLVPELDGRTGFGDGCTRYFDEIAEALAEGRAVKPVLVGPLTFLRLSKSPPGCDRLRFVEPLAAAYAGVLSRLRTMGIEWAQMDEPALCLDLEPEWLDAFDRAYALLAADAPRLLLATYFGSADHHAARIARLPVHGVHLDLVRAPAQLARWREMLPSHWVLSAGILDGRNVWRTDLRRALATLRPLHDALGDRLWLAPSCSLLHLPDTLDAERRLDPALRSWLAFARERLDELHVLREALDHGVGRVADALEACDAALASRRNDRRTKDDAVRARVARVTADMLERRSPHAVRIAAQRARLQLPPLPTTTIGSFPQTAHIRRARAAHRRGEMTHLAYLEAMRSEIRETVARQEALNLDVLVHGEPERNDMVEFFAGQLWGYAFTEHGWVQSYGSRCVKPPILYGDVVRPEPMTVEFAAYAQSLTAKPMKGMLTGPVTLLQWSFVRDDQPREATALQLALAIREEVEDLQRAGIRVIQIDEPALREGLPLRRTQWPAYLDWAVGAFRLAAAAGADDTQIHTHMCYSEFNDILPAIAAMDADVVTIESSRSKMELLDAFAQYDYPNDIGPGVYDIHAPRVPSVDEIVALLERAARVIPPERLWVNPDCGLKTRGWPETEAALANMVEAARRMRRDLGLEALPAEATA